MTKPLVEGPRPPRALDAFPQADFYLDTPAGYRRSLAANGRFELSAPAAPRRLSTGHRHFSCPLLNYGLNPSPNLNQYSLFMSHACSQDSSAFSRRDFLTATGMSVVASLASPVSGAP